MTMTQEKCNVLWHSLVFSSMLSFSLLSSNGTAATAPIPISRLGPSLAIDGTTVITAQEWRYEITATPLANPGAAPSNFSMVYDYLDAQNYSYVNFSSVDGDGLSGVYQIASGAAKKLASYANHVNPNQIYKVELRKKDGAAKLYLNNEYLLKFSASGNGRVGIGTLAADANFYTMLLKVGDTKDAVAVHPVPVGGVTTPPPPVVTPAPPIPPSIGVRQVHVTNSDGLKAALNDAQPGDVIMLADGNYTGKQLVGKYTGTFAITRAGTQAKPITLKGSRNAVIDGKNDSSHYGLYLVGANYWRIEGLTVANVGKGIILDGSSHVVIDGVKVANIGVEAIHFRARSSDNIVMNSEIAGTGGNKPQYGEGVYIGSANSHWGDFSDGQPDTSDRNQVIGNRFTGFTAEAIDIKEGSSDGLIANNYFEGSSLSNKNSADSWIDVKGNNYTLIGNSGVNTYLDGYQVHSVYPGWGYNNVFKNNTANVNAAGYGFNIVSDAKKFGNIVYCSNTVTNAGAGYANIACTPD